MIEALDIAWYFVNRGKALAMTQLVVQKLTYYAQGYFLGIYGKPLFDDPIEAWKFGPVVTSLRVLQIYGSNQIPIYQPFGQQIKDISTLTLLNSIWKTYGSFTSDMLVAMTHSDFPWQEAHQRGEGTVISQDSMQNYFLNRSQDINLDSTEDEVMATVFLKDNRIEQVPILEIDKYLEENADRLQPRKIPACRRRII